MTYKPIELRPLGGKAERYEENMGVNTAGNRRHRRRVPLPVWFAVAFLVVVLLGCLATIVYVNICGDPEGEEEESQEDGKAMNGSWAAVLGGRVDHTGILNRHIEVVDLREGCREAVPRLPPLPESLVLGDSLTASFQPGQGLTVCGSPPSQSLCFVLSSGSSKWKSIESQEAFRDSAKSNPSTKGKAGGVKEEEEKSDAALLHTKRGSYMLGGTGDDGQPSKGVLKWDPGVKEWHQTQGSLREGRIGAKAVALPCNFQALQAPPKFHRLLDMKPFT